MEDHCPKTSLNISVQAGIFIKREKNRTKKSGGVIQGHLERSLGKGVGCRGGMGEARPQRSKGSGNARCSWIEAAA